jgi:hypothetical protein
MNGPGRALGCLGPHSSAVRAIAQCGHPGSAARAGLTPASVRAAEMRRAQTLIPLHTLRGLSMKPVFVVLALAACALGSQAANATWKANSTTDPLTKEKHPYMSTAGKGAVRQFGHPVSSQLVIFCAQPPEQGVPYLSVDFWFSERVAVGGVKTRIRFDTGLVHEREIEGSDNGNQFTLLRRLRSDDGFGLDEFETSKKLRTQVSLPWAGDTVIEFDTSGASEALNKMPCEER